jgi:hypothetical protein
VKLRACLVGVALALLPAGCGGTPYKVAPVSGRVLLDGRPLPKAAVMFIPAAGAAGGKETLPSSTGLTDESGHYSLVLNSGSKAEGAVVGKHKVVILMGAAAGADDTKPTLHRQLPQRYNRKTELERDVPPEGRSDADFDLKSK